MCADMDGDVMYEVTMKRPIGLVIGNEGEGVGRLSKTLAILPPESR